MNEREKTIRLWFDMWLNQQDMGIDDIFYRRCDLYRKLESPV